MKVLHVNQIDGRGGAAGICLALCRALRGGGHQSALMVGERSRDLPGVKLLDSGPYRSSWGRFCIILARKLNKFSGRVRGAQRVSERWLPRVGSPRRLWSWLAGYEDFDSPGTKHLLEQAPFRPDVLHLHNLHGSYFDLRELPRLSRAVPTIITLHDAWLLAGHCSHSFDCEQWKIGCGSCSRLDIPPAVRRDGTAFNWQRKRNIYQNSDLWLVCPSQWLADRVKQSILMPGAGRLRVIPNGVDTSLFRPGDRAAARQLLGWPQEAFIILFAAACVRQNIWKDYSAMREAIRLAGEKANGRPIRFFAVGDTALAEQAGAATIEFLPYRDSLVECYQAADVYLHAAKADTFPTVVLEAQACGTPVVATAVGGIPEQIIQNKTGFLVPAGDAAALAERLIHLIRTPELVLSMGAAASQDAVGRFSLERMVDEYLKLYEEVATQKAVTSEYAQ